MRRRGAILVLVLAGMLTVLAPVGVAASCIGPPSVLRHYGGELIALIGVVRDRDGDTARLTVGRWLAGAGQAGQVTVDDKFRVDDGALRVGVEYVVVAVPFDPPRDEYYLSDCVPAAPQDSREGRYLLGLIEHRFDLPETDSTTLATRGEPTFALLGFGLAGGLVAAGLLRRRRRLN